MSTGKRVSIIQLTSHPVYFLKRLYHSLVKTDVWKTQNKSKVFICQCVKWHFQEVGWVKSGVSSLSWVHVPSPPPLMIACCCYLAERSPAVRPTPGWTQPSPSTCERAAGSVWRWWSLSASACPPSPSPETPAAQPGDPEDIYTRFYSVVIHCSCQNVTCIFQ